jgi:hypothetical protein
LWRTDVNDEPRQIFELQSGHQASSLWQDEGAAEHQSLDLAPSILLVSSLKVFHVFGEGFGAWDTAIGVVDYNNVFAGGKHLVDGIVDDLYIRIEVLERG